MHTTNGSLKNHFLIAMRALTDGPFANSITYLCEHTKEGAMGIVINRPLDINFDTLCNHLNVDMPNHLQQPILVGGPVSMEHSFVLHSHTDRNWESSMAISDQVMLTTSQDIISAIICDEGPHSSLVALGYAGWGAGQLESEIIANAWLTIPANSNIIFDTPIELRAKSAAATFGIDLSLISQQAGHA